VLVHGRTEAKATAACATLRARAPKAEVVPVWGDLGSLAQVRALAAQVKGHAPALDVLLNNAGVFCKTRELSADGFELTFAVNHLAPFLLTHLLRDALLAAPQGRVVNVSSIAHARGELDADDLQLERSFTGYGAYAASKLANVYFTHELARRLAGTAVTTSALHPGVIGTKLLRKGFGGMGGASLASGARTSVYCATAPGLPSGRYYSDGAEVPCAAQANDPALERALWEKSSALTGVPN
jgi:NAD(P)-dependent dehydrogenase (short-subunit alcohol dehydrogenase family)